MFTGIIQDLGTVSAVEHHGGDLSIWIQAGSFQSSPPNPGDSIAVNGVCLTVVEINDGLKFDVSRETLDHTRLGDLQAGSMVNLEPALKLGDALGGHLVSGHVDGIARIKSINTSARSTVYDFAAENSFAPYIAVKGSVTLDGISLTVNDVSDQGQDVIFSVNIVPHTLQHTNLGSRQCGDGVHLEVDQIARYLQRMLSTQNSPGIRHEPK